MTKTLSLPNPDTTNPSAAAPDATEDKAKAPTVAPAEPVVAEQPAAKAPPDHSALLGKRTWVVAVYGDMVNLLTAEVVGTDPKKVKIDQFHINQLDAGKMALHIDEA